MVLERQFVTTAFLIFFINSETTNYQFGVRDYQFGINSESNTINSVSELINSVKYSETF